MAGEAAFIADTGNDRIHRVDLATGLLRTISLRDAADRPFELDEPTELTADPAGGELFAIDRGGGGGRVFRVVLSDPASGVVSRVGAAQFARPIGLSFHEFPNGLRNLFVADAGRRRIFRVDLATNVVSALGFTMFHLFDRCADGSFELLDEQNPFRPASTTPRILYSMTGAPRSDGGFDLFVAADVGDPVSKYIVQIARGQADCDFDDCPELVEFDCADGIDDDGDGRIDLADADCGRPLQTQVLRIAIGPDGRQLPFLVDSEGRKDPAPGDATFDVDFLRVLRGHREFQVKLVDSCICPGATISSPVALDLPGLADVTAMAAVSDEESETPRTFLFLLCSAKDLIHLIELRDDRIARTEVVAGTEFERALPFDGRHPLETRLRSPRGLAVDSLSSLYIADTVNNRVRRAWIGEAMGE